MDKNRILSKLESDLSHFLISELCKNDPSKRSSSEMYKYKGLNLSANVDDFKTKREHDKLLIVGIGALEAKFRIDSGAKTSGNLSPEEEKLIQIWLAQSENSNTIRRIYASTDNKKEIAIIPFDLEEFYTKG